MWWTQYDQAINNLAVSDENKLKIIDAGALPNIVKLLQHDRSESEQQAAAQALWMLAFLNKESVIEQEGCLEGCDYFFCCYYIVYSARKPRITVF